MSRFRRAAVAAIALVVTGSALAACGGGSGSGSGSGAVKVGVVMELTGSYGQYGQQGKAGVQAALHDAGASGKKLDIKYYDCGANTAACVTMVREASTKYGAQAVLGPIVSLDLIPTEAVTTSLGVAQLMCTVNAGLTDGKPNVFRFGDTENVNNDAQAAYIAHRIKPGQSVVIMAASNDYGQEAAKNLTATLKSTYNISVAKTISIQLGQPDYTPALLQARAANPGFIALFTQPAADTAAVLKGAKQNGVNAQFVMDAGPDIASVAGSASNGLIQVGPWFPTGETPEQASFVKLAKASASITTPSWIAAMFYDSTKALIQSVNAGATTKASIVKSLQNLKNFHGVAQSDGSMSADRMYIQKAAVVELQDGVYHSVTP